jgi:AmmeMemoRadiSam system protein A
MCRVESFEHQRQLLMFARETAEQELGLTGKGPGQKPEVPGRFGGTFVTFWRGKTLRGCVGTFSATTDIAATIAEMTRASLNDSRFAANPITGDELEDLEIELSILSDPEPTDDPGALVPGTHGVIIRRGMQSGCFLPKVASERGWSADTFLSNCCTMKAGLEADAWREPDTDVLLFTAQVFSESQLSGRC